MNYKVFLFASIAACHSFGEQAFADDLRFLEFNEGRFEVMRTADLPSETKAEIDRLMKSKKPGVVEIKDLAAFRKAFRLEEKARVFTLDGTLTEPVSLKGMKIYFQKKGDCTNYPDVYLSGAYSKRLSQTYGIAVPNSTKVLQKSTGTEAIKTAIGKGLEKQLQTEAMTHAASTVYFQLDGETYSLTPGLGQGAFIGRIKGNKYELVQELKLLSCGT